MKRVESHIFAGLGGWFTSAGTRAIQSLLDDLPSPAKTEHHYHREWEATADRIIANIKHHGDKPIVILGGHSYGAWKAQQIAKRLAALRIRVDYLYGIDPTALPSGAEPMVVTDNVAFIDEFWSTSGWFNAPLWKRRLKPDGSQGGRYVYPPHWGEDRRHITVVPGGHIPCASADVTRRTIVNHVRGLLK